MKRGRRERAVTAALLLLCAVCGASILIATDGVERANARRRAQIDRLASHLSDPGVLPAGAIDALDGLFGLPLRRVVSVTGPVIEFARPAPGSDT
ncbi:MAG: hypothetical protein AB7O97_06695 [Planctomycetota bacterium]